jgi:hypothetical protein
MECGAQMLILSKDLFCATSPYLQEKYKQAGNIKLQIEEGN